jgi:prevent-host-death family protein
MSMSIAEAKSQFSSVVERAAAGEEITITKHGKPLAKIVPVAQTHDQDRARRAFERMRELRKGVTLGDLSVREMIEEGRR